MNSPSCISECFRPYLSPFLKLLARLVMCQREILRVERAVMVSVNNFKQPRDLVDAFLGERNAGNDMVLVASGNTYNLNTKQNPADIAILTEFPCSQLSSF